MSQKRDKADSDLMARRYLVHGRVQGVGFRWFVEDCAQKIGVRGYTKNLDDGGVEVYAIGTREQLMDLNERLWKGPRMAQVRSVEEFEASMLEYEGFRISI